MNESKKEHWTTAETPHSRRMRHRLQKHFTMIVMSKEIKARLKFSKKFRIKV